MKSLWGKGVWRWQGAEKVRAAGIKKKKRREGFPRPVLPLLSLTSLRTLSNPWLLKTSRRLLLLITRLSNPIAVAQTQSRALNPLESDCSSRVKWLRLHCHSLGRRHRPATCSELLKWEPSHRPDWPTYPGSHWPHMYLRWDRDLHANSKHWLCDKFTSSLDVKFRDQDGGFWAELFLFGAHKKNKVCKDIFVF